MAQAQRLASVSLMLYPLVDEEIISSLSPVKLRLLSSS
jgi:hypothetical protein